MSNIPSLSIDAIIDLLGFTKAKPVDTRKGTLLFRSAPIMELAGQMFWKSWQRHKVDWLQRGFSVSGAGSSWNVVQWLHLDGSLTDVCLEMIAQAKRNDGGRTRLLPMDWIPNDVTLRAPASSLLRSYQQPSCLRLVRALLGKGSPFGEGGVYGTLKGNALDASDTGSGKTYVALAACQELQLRPCIIAPLAVLPAWRRASFELGVPLGWLINYDKIRGGKSGLGRWKQEVNMNTGKLEDRFHFDYLPPNPLLIFDECQGCKNADTLQSKIMRDADRAGIKILGVSATAAEKTAHMRVLGGALGLHAGTNESFKDWCANLEGRVAGKFDPKKPMHLQKLHQQVFPLRGTRIRTSEIPDFPEVSIVAESFDTGHTKEIAAAYAEMDRKLEALKHDQTKTSAQKRGMGLAAMMAARMEAEKNKVDLFLQMAKDGLEEGKAPIIFLNFKVNMARVAAELKVPIIWGADLDDRPQKPEVRQQIIDDFQQDRIPAVVVSLGAGGAGISLHDKFHGKHPRYGIISPSYSAVQLKQAFGRPHRDGAKTKSYLRVVFAAGTIEDDICASMKDKVRNIDTINDGALAPKSVLEFVRYIGGASFDAEAA